MTLLGSRFEQAGLVDTAAAGRETAQLVGAAAILIGCQAMLIWLTRDLTHETATTITAVLPLILGLSLPTTLLLVMALRVPQLRSTRTALVIVFFGGLLLRAVWFGTPAPLEDDFRRYMWDGAVLAHGLSPYQYAPERFLDPAVAPSGYEAIATTGRETIESINFPDLRTIYPSVAQLAFALAYLIAPFQIDGLRLVFLAAEIATFLLLLALLPRVGASPLWSILYWWNPMLAFALVGIAHVDALVPPFVLGALLLAVRARAVAAVALLAAGAGVKMWPILLAPLVLAQVRKDPRRVMLGGAVLAALLVVTVGPVLLSTLQPNAGLAAYASSWGNNNAFFAWALYSVASLIGDQGAQAVLRVGVALAAAAAALVAAARSDGTVHSLACWSLVVAAAVFYLSPAQFPWYAVWFLPLAVLVQSWPLLLASATLPAYYLYYPLWAAGHGNAFFFGAAFLHSMPVLAWLSVDALRRRRRRARDGP